jgi:hypothetical protein
MKSVMIRNAFTLLLIVGSAACVAESGAPDGDEPEETSVQTIMVGRYTDDSPKSSAKPKPAVPETGATTNNAAGPNEGPQPDPWRRTGPQPDPWNPDEPAPSGSPGGGGGTPGGGGSPGGGGNGNRD